MCVQEYDRQHSSLLGQLVAEQQKAQRLDMEVGRASRQLEDAKEQHLEIAQVLVLNLSGCMIAESARKRFGRRLYQNNLIVCNKSTMHGSQQALHPDHSVESC